MVLVGCQRHEGVILEAGGASEANGFYIREQGNPKVVFTRVVTGGGTKMQIKKYVVGNIHEIEIERTQLIRPSSFPGMRQNPTEQLDDLVPWERRVCCDPTIHEPMLELGTH